MPQMMHFNAAYSRANLLYDVEIQPVDFEEIALSAFYKIGNKRTRVYHAVLHPKEQYDGSWMATLPCNCEEIEAVTLAWGENWQYTSNLHLNGNWNSHYVENYIESRKVLKSPLYEPGIFAKYELVGNDLYFRENYGEIHLLYKGILCDDDGLPQLTEKEIEAIAAYIAYITKMKAAWRINDVNSLRLAKEAEATWHRLCSEAHVPEHATQNDMDRILDAKSSFNRKRLGWSFKPSR